MGLIVKWPPCITKPEQLGKKAMQLVTCSLKEENEELATQPKDNGYVWLRDMSHTQRPLKKLPTLGTHFYAKKKNQKIFSRLDTVLVGFILLIN